MAESSEAPAKAPYTGFMEDVAVALALSDKPEHKEELDKLLAAGLHDPIKNPDLGDRNTFQAQMDAATAVLEAMSGPVMWPKDYSEENVEKQKKIEAELKDNHGMHTTGFNPLPPPDQMTKAQAERLMPVLMARAQAQ